MVACAAAMLGFAAPVSAGRAGGVGGGRAASATAWPLVGELAGADTSAGDAFGFAVAVSGATAVVSAPGHATVTTHLFVADSPYIDSDAVFGVKESLVQTFPPVDDSGLAATYGVANPFRSAHFDIRLPAADQAAGAEPEAGPAAGPEPDRSVSPR